jgi:hypothetical protein
MSENALDVPAEVRPFDEGRPTSLRQRGTLLSGFNNPLRSHPRQPVHAFMPGFFVGALDSPVPGKIAFDFVLKQTWRS